MMNGFERSLAFLVAIDRYENGIPCLKTPVADANALSKVLEEYHGFEVRTAKNEDASLENLRDLLSEMVGRAGPDDRVLFYFAGHGIALEGDDGPTGFILPHDARKDAEAEKSFLPMAELDELLSAVPCRHMLVILDCCFAGAFRWSNFRHFTVAAGNLHQERYKWFIEDPAWQVIASSAHDQKALDVAAGSPLGERADGNHHSPFARALIEGLKGKADLAPVGGKGDGVITATELYHFIDEELRISMNDKRQKQMPILWPMKKHDKGQFVFLVPGIELDLPPAPPLDPDANPWRALNPYEEKHKDLFYGRGAASDRLAQRLLGKDALEGKPAIPLERFIVVTGPSGIGKSSLVKAGLLPRLPKTLIRSIIVRPSSPGPSVFASLAVALREANTSTEASPDENMLKVDKESLTRWVRRQDDEREVLIIIDQIEELVTIGSDTDQLQTFTQLIATALDQTESGLRVVFTVRSEFEPQFAQSALKDRWPSARYLVPQMTQDELRRVIEGPATVKVMRFESSELVDTLVNEVVNMPGGLPLLSFALSQMYRHYLDRRGTDRALTKKDYDALQGGVTGSLRIRANQVVDEANGIYVQTARRVLERLVSIEAGEFARRRVFRWEFESDDPAERVRVNHVLNRLDEERLIVTDSAVHQEEGTKGYVELAHDALLLGWDRMLTWIREDAVRINDLRRLTDAAEKWQSQDRKKSIPLWDEADELKIIQRLLTSPFPGLNLIERDFACVSQARAKRNAKIRRSAVLTLVLLVVGAAFLGELWREQRNEAVARLVASEGFRISSDDSGKALPYYLSSLAISETPNAISGLVAAIQDDPHMAMRLVPLPGDLASLAVRQSDNSVLIGLKTGDVLVWPISNNASGAGEAALTDGSRTELLSGIGSSILAIASTSDASRIVALDQSGNILEWSPPKAGHPPIIKGKLSMGHVSTSYIDGSPYVSISNDASTIAVSTWTAGIHLWRNGQILNIKVPNSAGGPIALSPDGRKLAVGLAGEDSIKFAAAIIDSDNRDRSISRLEMPYNGEFGFGFAMSYYFDPNGHYFAGGTSESNVFVLDLSPAVSSSRTFRPINADMNAGGEINRIIIGANGKYIAAYYKKSWSIWDVKTGVRIGKPIPDEGGIAVLDASGERLIVSNGPRMIHVIDLSLSQLKYLACLKRNNTIDPNEWDRITGGFQMPCICSENNHCQ